MGFRVAVVWALVLFALASCSDGAPAGTRSEPAPAQRPVELPDAWVGLTAETRLTTIDDETYVLGQFDGADPGRELGVARVARDVELEPVGDMLAIGGRDLWPLGLARRGRALELLAVTCAVGSSTEMDTSGCLDAHVVGQRLTPESDQWAVVADMPEAALDGSLSILGRAVSIGDGWVLARQRSPEDGALLEVTVSAISGSTMRSTVVPGTLQALCPDGDRALVVVHGAPPASVAGDGPLDSVEGRTVGLDGLVGEPVAFTQPDVRTSSSSAIGCGASLDDVRLAVGSRRWSSTPDDVHDLGALPPDLALSTIDGQLMVGYWAQGDRNNDIVVQDVNTGSVVARGHLRHRGDLALTAVTPIGTEGVLAVVADVDRAGRLVLLVGTG